MELDKAKFEAESQTIRAELKAWENEWAASHRGKKPGRDDIKKNQDIAQKYKQYNKIRDILSGKIPPPNDQDREVKKRKTREPSQTPAKRQKYGQTPSSSRIQRDSGILATPSISRKLFSPATVTSVGPTPQRDGRVLGLFDLLGEKELATPSRKVSAPSKVDNQPRAFATPRKGAKSAELSTTPAALGKTPTSARREHPLLDAFWTPLKKSDANVQNGATPASVSKLHFSTPAFLKRHSLPTVDENGEYGDVQPARLPRKPLVRGLSAIVASLRQVEEEKLDDDLDALREMEDAEAGIAPQPRPRPQSAPQTQAQVDEILAADSQAGRLLGGLDDEDDYDSPVEEQKDRGQPLRVFKKKGQKRTTKRVNMRPVRVKRAAADGPADADDGEEIVPETQVGVEAATAEETMDPDADFDDLEDDSGSEAEPKKKPVKAKKSKQDAAKKDGPKKDGEKADGPVKRAAKKVNALAHTNFKRLKLKNSGAKGRPGFNSKFRRRR